MITKTTALEIVHQIYTAGINSAVRLIRAENAQKVSKKDALYMIILAAQEAGCSELAARACTKYETAQD